MYVPSYRTKTNDMPILSKAEINSIAEAYILDFCPKAITEPQPIDIETFIEQYLGLALDFQYLSHNGIYLGMTVFNDTHKIPVYNSSENRAEYMSARRGTIIIESSLLEENTDHRYRYTCGHESGHWVFHKNYYGWSELQTSLYEDDHPYISCRNVGQWIDNVDTRRWDEKKWMEWQADKFSSSLLMPKSSVQAVISNKSLGLSDVSHVILYLSELYNVSKEAAFYRLCDLGYVRQTSSQLSFFE